MNAADRRRLTPVLGALAVALVLLLIALWLGLGSGVGWRDSQQAPTLPAAEAATPPPTVPPLERYREVWEHPLFSPTRTPEPAANQQGATGELQLTGVIMLPGFRMAILHDRSSGKDYRVIEGQSSRGGPALLELHPRSAVVKSGGSRVELHLIPGPSPEAGKAPPPTSGQSADQQSADQQDEPPEADGAGHGASAMVTRHEQADAGSASSKARVRELRARIEARRRRAKQGGG